MCIDLTNSRNKAKLLQDSDDCRVKEKQAGNWYHGVIVEMHDARLKKDMKILENQHKILQGIWFSWSQSRNQKR